MAAKVQKRKIKVAEPKWNGMCPARRHGLDYQGQNCDLCAEDTVEVVIVDRRCAVGSDRLDLALAAMTRSTATYEQKKRISEDVAILRARVRELEAEIDVAWHSGAVARSGKVRDVVQRYLDENTDPMVLGVLHKIREELEKIR